VNGVTLGRRRNGAPAATTRTHHGTGWRTKVIARHRIASRAGRRFESQVCFYQAGAFFVAYAI
jgi:hypothetical protein